MGCQGDDMGRLGLRGRITPLSAPQVDVSPSGASQLAWANEEERSELEGGCGDWRALVGIYGPKQLPDLCGLRQCGKMGCLRLLQSARQVGRGVPLSAASGDGVAEHLARVRSGAVGGLYNSTTLKLSQRIQKQRRSYFCDRQVSDAGHVLLDQSALALYRLRAQPLLGALLQQLQANGAEGGRSLPGLCDALYASHVRRIRARSDQGPKSVSLCTSVGQPHGWVFAKGDHARLAGVPVAVPPDFGATRAYLEA